MGRELFIGCISGTSLDGLDLVTVEFDNGAPKVIGSKCAVIPTGLQAELSALCSPGPNEIERMGRSDVALGRFIGESINTFLTDQSIEPTNIIAIGSHGQTIRHHPDGKHPFSMQIGAPSAIAEVTGITTVADFRMADIMAGGQGAPLVPFFHQKAFSSEQAQRLIINLGGISNISILPLQDARKSVPAFGYDIGPANTLMDRWTEKHISKSYDAFGLWAREGQLDKTLLSRMLGDAYFSREMPKSTGREYFNMPWLEQFLEGSERPEDVQRTLLELCASTIATAIQNIQNSHTAEAYLCGGGAHNSFLVERIKSLSKLNKIGITDDLGIPVDDVEAAAFAWLARETLEGRPGNLRTVTGAKKAKILGAVHFA
jgi:anhydro-N-acetylmuramic acid kinase